MAEYILVINPGSTSTKVAIYDGEKELHTYSIDHPAEDLKKSPRSTTSWRSERRPFWTTCSHRA